jgi:DNA processing protein
MDSSAPRHTHGAAVLRDPSTDAWQALASLERALNADGHPGVKKDAIARIALSLLDRPGDAVIGQIARRDGAEEAFCLVLETHLLQESSRGALRRAGPSWPQFLAEAVKVALRAAESLNLTFHSPANGVRAPSMRDLGDSCPLGLWTAGNHELLGHEGLITVLGGRTGSTRGRSQARQVVADLASAGRVIVTPASTGTDLDVVDAAIDAGGRVLAIVPGGIDRIPAIAAEASSRILAGGGALVTEAPPGTRATQLRTLARSRLLAAVSPQVLVLEAGRHSPAVATARIASDLGRDVAVLTGAIGPGSDGSRDLVDELTGRPVTGADELAPR